MRIEVSQDDARRNCAKDCPRQTLSAETSFEQAGHRMGTKSDCGIAPKEIIGYSSSLRKPQNIC